MAKQKRGKERVNPVPFYPIGRITGAQAKASPKLIKPDALVIEDDDMVIIQSGNLTSVILQVIRDGQPVWPRRFVS